MQPASLAASRRGTLHRAAWSTGTFQPQALAPWSAPYADEHPPAAPALARLAAGGRPPRLPPCRQNSLAGTADWQEAANLAVNHSQAGSPLHVFSMSTAGHPTRDRGSTKGLGTSSLLKWRQRWLSTGSQLTRLPLLWGCTSSRHTSWCLRAVPPPRDCLPAAPPAVPHLRPSLGRADLNEMQLRGAHLAAPPVSHNLKRLQDLPCPALPCPAPPLHRQRGRDHTF